MLCLKAITLFCLLFVLTVLVCNLLSEQLCELRAVGRLRRMFVRSKPNETRESQSNAFRRADSSFGLQSMVIFTIPVSRLHL